MSTSPSIAELRAALTALYPEQDQLEQAIRHFAAASQPDVPHIDGVDVDLQRQSRCGFRK